MLTLSFTVALYFRKKKEKFSELFSRCTMKSQSYILCGRVDACGREYFALSRKLAIKLPSFPRNTACVGWNAPRSLKVYRGATSRHPGLRVNALLGQLKRECRSPSDTLEKCLSVLLISDYIQLIYYLWNAIPRIIFKNAQYFQKFPNSSRMGQ